MYERTNWPLWWTIWGVMFGVIVLLWMTFYPPYSVWQQGLTGEAELARAEQNRKIAIQAAKAKDEAAEYLAAADVKRAKGIAKANTIIGDSLRDNEAYIRWLWVDGLTQSEEQKPSVIYVPTEAGLPILEAGKR